MAVIIARLYRGMVGSESKKLPIERELGFKQ